jgi:hypothetical protein
MNARRVPSQDRMVRTHIVPYLVVVQRVVTQIEVDPKLMRHGKIV